jgi:magnesium transporter
VNEALVRSSRPRSWFRAHGGALRRDLPEEEVRAILDSGQGALWVDIDSRVPEQHAWLQEVFRFHPLSIEDTLSAEGRVKFEVFERYALVVVRGVRYLEETDELYDIETFNLWAFLGANFVVTVHGPHAPGVEQAAADLERSASLIERDAARLLHHILDATVDAYFPLLDRLDEFVDGLEERVFTSFEREALRDIFAVKRLVLTLRRHLAPMREVFNTMQYRPCGFIPTETQLYFRDIYDHVIRLNESLENYRDLLTTTLDAYLTQVSNRMNQVTKGLTVVATLSVPFVVVSGMWGMNFDEVPLSHSAGGFWILLALQLGLGFGLLWILKRRGWL